MRGKLRQLGWLLLLLMFSGAVACAVEKSASGQKACVPEAQQGKQVVTDCLHVEKSRTPVKGSPDLVKPIFNKEKEQHRLQAAQLIGEIGSQAGDIAETQGKIAGLAAAKAKYGNLSADQLSKTQEYKDAMKPYGKGSALQQGIQAATAAVQGLAGGDIAKAIAGGSSPYLAEVIHKMTTDPTTGKVNTEANLMAHAVLGAVVSQINGNSALAGASGAVAGEIIAQQLYPGVAKKDLTEEQRQTVSALGTLAAGLVGGIVGNSSADAVAGAQAGKNAVENNSLGAMGGSDLGFWLGKTPDATTEEKAKLAGDIAKGNTVVSAGIASTAGVGALTAEQAAMWALGAGANAGMQYASTGEVNPVNSVAAGWINVVTMGQGWKGTIAWNAAGGVLTNAINGDDPLTGAITNGIGAGFGYGVGNYVVKPVANTAGKWITGGWNPKFDPNLLKYTEVKGQLGISKEMLPSNLPGAVGNVTGSFSSEYGSGEAQKIIDKVTK